MLQNSARKTPEIVVFWVKFQWSVFPSFQLTVVNIGSDNAWHWSGNKPLSKPMMVEFTGTYMHHLASMNLLDCFIYTGYFIIICIYFVSNEEM